MSGQPEFHRDELVLMLDFLLDEKRGPSRDLGDLCLTLQSLSLHPDRGDEAVFRESGVGMALCKDMLSTTGFDRPSE